MNEQSKTVKLSNGVEMPLIGLGTMHTYGSECISAIHAAADIGYRMFDTAAIYGNERAVGRAVNTCGVPREQLFITTKLWVQDADERHARAAYERSLDNLGLDYVDLYLIHQPLGDIYGAWRALERLYEGGRVRAIGVSNLNIGRIVDLSMHNVITPHVCQTEIHPFYQQERAVKEMEHIGVRPEGWAPFAEGRNNIFKNPVLEKIGEKYGKTAAQVILRWNIERGIPCVPKSSRPERIHENFSVWDFSLTKKDMEEIAALDKGKELFFEHDSPELARMFGGYKIH